jgi:murein DD-endopeptidase MepM/ murein hydrolase activator NlpD
LADTAQRVVLVPPATRVAAAPGQLLVPVQGVTAGQLVDTYTQARGQGRVHDAIDIAAARGTPVLATTDGVVLKLFQSARGGITLYELGPDGRTLYYYAHLDRYAAGVGEGRPLHRGDVLGYVGDTGNAGAGNYHLHFEVSTTADPRRYWAGTPQNPYPLLQPGGSQR